MAQTSSAARSAGGAVALGLILALGGCGGVDGVEFNGAVFDTLGLNQLSGKGAEPKVAQRPGIVLPPSTTAALPTPGSGQAAQAAVEQELPADHDQRRVLAAADRDRIQEEFCRKALIEAELRQNPGRIEGPFGSCNPSIFKAMTGRDDMTTSIRDPSKTRREGN